MKWELIDFKEYSSIFKGKYLSVFESAEFIELNRSKAEDIYYLIYRDSKIRFGTIAGLQNFSLKFPFSAPYSNFSTCSNDIKIEHYHAAVSDLELFSKSKGLSSILFTIPPFIYSNTHLTKLSHAFRQNSFSLKIHDLNHHFDLSKFNTSNYIECLTTKSRQKLKSALNYELIFEETKDITTVYQIIKSNREEKNYPLKMTEEQLTLTFNKLGGNLFLVKTPSFSPIAAAVTYNTSPDNVQIIYWANLPNTDEMKPMNYMAFKIFEYFSNKKKLIDIGPSSDQSLANYGLCDFKESIGCETSAKLTYYKEF